MVLLIVQTQAYVRSGDERKCYNSNWVGTSSPKSALKTCSQTCSLLPSLKKKKKKRWWIENTKGFSRRGLTSQEVMMTCCRSLEVRAQAPEVAGAEGRKGNNDQFASGAGREGGPGSGRAGRGVRHKHKHALRPGGGRTHATSPFPAPGPRGPLRTEGPCPV